MTCIAVIPARGGSRRIPRKNIRDFHGKPIIAYSIEAAKASGVFSAVWVSSEDEEIGRIAEGCGAQWYKRPIAIADDETGTQDVVRDFLSWQNEQGEEWRYACCVYPCAPMLTASALRGAHTILLASACNYVVPVATWLYDPGQFYMGRADAFLGRSPLLGPNTRLMPIDPRTECDINTEEDWQRAEAMFLKLKGQA